MSSATDDCPYYIPTRPERPPSPIPPPPPPAPLAPAPSALPVIHIHLATPQAEAAPVSPRPWYFTGTGLLWLLFALAALAAGAYVALQYLTTAGWL